MTTASAPVHAQQNGTSSGVQPLNAYPDKIPRSTEEVAWFWTFIYTLGDVLVFLATAIGYILQVSWQLTDDGLVEFEHIYAMNHHVHIVRSYAFAKYFVWLVRNAICVPEEKKWFV